MENSIKSHPLGLSGSPLAETPHAGTEVKDPSGRNHEPKCRNCRARAARFITWFFKHTIPPHTHRRGSRAQAAPPASQGAGPPSLPSQLQLHNRPCTFRTAQTEIRGRERSPHQTQKAQSQPLEGRSSGPCWFLGRPLPDGTDHGQEPPKPVRASRRDPPPPSQAAACPGRRPSQPEQARDRQLVRAPFPEKPHQR